MFPTSISSPKMSPPLGWTKGDCFLWPLPTVPNVNNPHPYLLPHPGSLSLLYLGSKFLQHCGEKCLRSFTFPPEMDSPSLQNFPKSYFKSQCKFFHFRKIHFTLALIWDRAPALCEWIIDEILLNRTLLDLTAIWKQIGTQLLGHFEHNKG